MPQSSSSSDNAASDRSNSGDSSSSSVDGKDVRVFASSFDDFVDEVLEVLPSLNLPIVTGDSHDNSNMTKACKQV
jgi:hypothetical protein